MASTRDRLVDEARRLVGPVAAELAAVYTDDVVFPDRVEVVAEPDGGVFPGWSGSVLVLAHETQGVCSWGLALDGPDAGAVVVGGDLELGEVTVVYAADLDTYVDGRRWDATCLGATPLLIAQAAPLSPPDLAIVARGWTTGPVTSGWPTAEVVRLERGDVRLLLWAGTDQCDWWLSGPEDQLAVVLVELRARPDLDRVLWSNDAAGTALLGRG